jgi:hypothetical protein
MTELLQCAVFLFTWLLIYSLAESIPVAVGICQKDGLHYHKKNTSVMVY